MTRTARRIFTATLGALPALGLAAAALVAGVTHDAPLAGFAPVDGVDAVVYAEIAGSKPVNVPTFASHGQSDCSPLVEGELVETVLVVTQDGDDVDGDGRPDPVRMGFDEAWDRAHDATWANDVWVVGQC